ncbi:MAG: radical SAM/SPASM domain-containing protein [Deltaproteobacteria bacterium]|nr:radical SAM/SPASM domain-containing protein [Deltaproteobacteria bacterium]
MPWQQKDTFIKMSKKQLSHSGLLTPGEALALSFVSPRFAYSNLKDKFRGELNASFPRFFVLHLTDRCNFSCPMCSMAESRRAHLNAGFSDLPIDLVQKLALEARRYGAILNLFGGEPLLYKQLDDVFDVILRNNLISYVTTNGLLVMKRAASLTRGRVNILQVSLDGWDEESQLPRGNVPGSFNIIADGIHHILSHKGHSPSPIVRVATTITRNNYHHLDSIQMLIHEWGVREWILNNYQFVTSHILDEHASFESTTGIGELIVGDRIGDHNYFDSGQVSELKNVLLRVRSNGRSLGMRICYNWDIDLDAYYSPAMPSRDSKCLLPFNRVDILADGSITLCMGGYTIGNLHDGDIHQAWYGDRRKHFLEALRSYGIFPMCFRCCGITDTLSF